MIFVIEVDGGEVRVLDKDDNPISSVLDGSDYRLMVQAALKVGDNVIGRVKLTDGTNVVAVLDDDGVYRSRVESKSILYDSAGNEVAVLKSGQPHLTISNDALDVLQQVLRELQRMNEHMSLITDYEPGE